jgi:hypothetical protein
MMWSHDDLRLTKGPVPGGRCASSVDFPVAIALATADALFLSLGRAPPALSTNKSDKAGSCQEPKGLFYHKEHKEHIDKSLYCLSFVISVFLCGK